MSPEFWPALIEGLAKIAFVWGVILAAVLPNLVWLERRVAAFIQDRPGPNRVGPFGLLQAGADVIKFFMKEDVTPTYADKVLYTVAPWIALVPSLVTFAVIPFGSTIHVFGRDVSLVIADVNIGILYVLAFTSLGVYGIVLAGWASNNKFSLMGAIRSSAQIISYELSMGLAAVGVFMAAGSLNLGKVVEYQSGGLWNVFPQFIGAVIFIVAAFAETNRLPFDLAESEAELVAGYHTEYSAFKFAMFFQAEYANLIAASGLITTLYFGGWSLPWITGPGIGGGAPLFTGLLAGILSILVFAVKTGLFVFVFLWVRWTLPRFRYDQLMDLGWKVFLPLSLLNLLWVGALIVLKVI